MESADKIIGARIADVRAVAEQAGLDLVIIFGRGVIGQYGYLRWIAGYTPCIRSGAALIGAEGKPILAMTSGSNRDLAAECTSVYDIRNIQLEGQGAGSLVGAAAEILGDKAQPRIGLVGEREIATSASIDALRAAFPHATFVPAGPLIEPIKARKSPDEIAALRRSAAILDIAFDAAVAALKADATFREAAGAAAQVLYANGGREVLIYISKGPHYLHRPHNHRLAKGEVATVCIEASNEDDYWTELFRLVSRGEPEPQAARMVADAERIMRQAETEFLVGRTGGEAYVALARTIGDMGYNSGLWLGHGTGFDRDLPMLGENDHTVLEAGMAIAFHPHLVSGDGRLGLSPGDTFLVGEDRAERLSQRSPELLVL